MTRNRERDTLFPSGSLGRSAPPQLQRVPSRESLNAHPLLTSSPPSNVQNHPIISPEDTLPKYVPYTPRHRPPTSAATTGTTTQLSVPAAPQPQTGATSRLQVQNLKAAAQSIGLGAGTVGWAILEKLVDGDAAHEWDDIWTVLTTAKPYLLLPLEPYSGEPITPDLVKDHLAIASSTGDSAVVTLSGLRGTIKSSGLTFQSTLSTISPRFAYLLRPESQAAALSTLPPLPTLSSSGQLSLPFFALPGTSTLPLPPRFHNAKPPLPPRPGGGGAKVTTSRISFASLFGRPSTPVQNPPASPSPSVTTLPGDDQLPPMQIVEVSAYAIGKKIVKKAIGKELSNIIQSELKNGLSSCPRWVVNRVIDFTAPLHPIPKPAKQIETRGPHRQILPTVSIHSDVSSMENAFQILYSSIEDDIHAGSSMYKRWRGKDDKRSAESDNEDDGPVENGKENGKEKDSETRIREIVEKVESVVCGVFYDRLFSPLTGDDASHDEALANRIAALNMLDLGLEHLGVEVPGGSVGEDVQAVVKACGDVLQKLEAENSHSPTSKSDLLVEAHKEIVDGLSKLPKLRLKPEEDIEPKDLKTPKPSSFAKQQSTKVVPEVSPVTPEIAIIPAFDDLPTPKPPPEDMVSNGGVNEVASALLETEPSGQSLSDSVDTVRPEDDSPTVPIPDSESPSSEDLPITPALASAKPSEPTTVSGDILFPFLIFSVVKSNPPHLVSHLLFTQRFRSHSAGGQESYCLINLMAVVEFLENVDMGALGLGDSERVMSTADLSPIPLAHGPIDAPTSPTSPFSIPQLGRRVNQQVEELAGLAGSANKVLTGVVDSSFGMLRGILGSAPADMTTPHGELQDAAPWNSKGPVVSGGFGLLRRGSGFSIGGVSVTGRPKTPAQGEVEEGQQLVEVSSRPGSLRTPSIQEAYDGETSTSEATDDDEDGDDGAYEEDGKGKGDTRSVRSFSSMMSRESRDRDRERERAEGRVSLADRLASMTKLGSSSKEAAAAAVAAAAATAEQVAKDSSPSPSRPTSRPQSWLPPPRLNSTPPAESTPGISPPPKQRIPQPNKRFMECAEQELRVGEVAELLREYRRMVLAARNAGLFED